MYAPDVMEPSVPWAVFSYSLHAVLVGVHTLAFFKSVRRLGTVPTAISKGAQQAGNFAFAHIFFCKVDPHECIWSNGPDDKAATAPGGGGGGTTASAWSHWQKSVAFLMCCVGCVMYILSKPTAAVKPTGSPIYSHSTKFSKWYTPVPAERLRE